MFDQDISITGSQVDLLKDLCVLAGNVPDKEKHNNTKIFNAYIDAYILCPLIGYQYSRKISPGSASEGGIGIRADALIRRSNEVKFVYQIIMLIDEESEPDIEKRIYRAFNFSEKTPEDKALVKANLAIYNSYFLGGVEVLHEEIVEKSTDEDSYINCIYEYVKHFNEEQDGELLKSNINKLLNV